MDWSRRTLVAAAGAGAGLAASQARARPAPKPARAPRPGEFLWGVATAAHQIEGNNQNNDFWVLERVKDTYYSEPSGDTCDSLHRWAEDIALVKAMGLNTYRFSVEWARVEPEEGFFSQAMLDHYRRICAACREAGITPMVTFHHFTSPRWVAGRGGWEEPSTADRLARYCERTAKALGELVDWGCTLNEPNAQVNSYIVSGEKPPSARDLATRAEAARRVGSDRFHSFFQGDGFKVRDTVIAAHHKAREAIKSAAPHMKVGVTLALIDMRKGPGGDGLYNRIEQEARTPFFAAADDGDFVGVQTYNTLYTGPDGWRPAGPDSTMHNRYGADASPAALSSVIRMVHRRCKAPIVVTENGIDVSDDAVRVRHLHASVAEVRACQREGIPVHGYVHWSLMDNFEWSSGYKPRFGLYAVDRQTFARTAKPSAGAYRRLVAQARRAERA